MRDFSSVSRFRWSVGSILVGRMTRTEIGVRRIRKRVWIRWSPDLIMEKVMVPRQTSVELRMYTAE